jgi:hypothetical protein
LRFGSGIFAPSLGNFVFDQMVDENRITAILQVELDDAGGLSFHYLPCHMNDLYQPEEAPEYTGYIEEINGYLRDCFDVDEERYAGLVTDRVQRGHRSNRIRMRGRMLAHFWDYVPYLSEMIRFRRREKAVFSVIDGEASLDDGVEGEEGS